MSLDGWKRASFLVGSESNVRHWEPLPGGSVRPSGPCCLGVAEAPFVSLDGWKRASLGAVARRQEAITGNKRQEARKKKPGSNKRLEDRSEKQETRSQEATSSWKTGQRASFLVDSESNVRQAAGRQVRELVFLSIQKATLGRRLEDSSES